MWQKHTAEVMKILTDSSLALETCKKAAFATLSAGLYHFTRMPFGLHGTATSFQRVMDKVLLAREQDCAVACIDDILSLHFLLKPTLATPAQGIQCSQGNWTYS